MSVLGMVDAMRSNFPLSVRMVWICLENHANGHRFWNLTIAAIADELHLSADSVKQAIRVLEAAGIIRRRLRKRRSTVFYMMRSYPPAGQRVAEPDDEAPEINPDDADLRGENIPLNEPAGVAVEGEKIAPVCGVEGGKNRPPVPTSKNPPVCSATLSGSAHARETVPAQEQTSGIEQATPGTVRVWRSAVGAFVEEPDPDTVPPWQEAMAAMGTPDPSDGSPTIAGWNVDYVVTRAAGIARCSATRAGSRRAVARWLLMGVQPSVIFKVLGRATRWEGYQPPGTLMAFTGKHWAENAMRIERPED